MKIDKFSGRYAFLSNFYVERDGLTLEHRYQAAKTRSTEEKAWVMDSPTPGIAKYRGRKVHMQADWDAIKLEVMELLVRSKFENDPGLARKLLETGDAELIEGNTWGDTFWGVCNGRGQNHLGKILMKVREGLRK